jgi:hypothetical protein
MVTRRDPARTGVRAGRVVGLLTVALAVASLVAARDTFYAGVAPLLDLLGVGSAVPASALFWGTVAFAAGARYTACYVVGSLVGVCYDWLDDPTLPVLVVATAVVGAADGTLAAVRTQSVAFGVAYALAWLCYVPAFVWLSEDGDGGDDRPGARRL